MLTQTVNELPSCSMSSLGGSSIAGSIPLTDVGASSKKGVGAVVGVASFEATNVAIRGVSTGFCVQPTSNRKNSIAADVKNGAVSRGNITIPQARSLILSNRLLCFLGSTIQIVYKPQSG